MPASDEELQAFAQHVEEEARQRGIVLDDNDRRELFRESMRAGFTMGSTVDAFDRLYGAAEDDEDDELADDDAVQFTEDLDRGVKGLEERLGRPLLKSELQGLGVQTLGQLQRGGEPDFQAALDAHYEHVGGQPPDLDTREGRNEWMAQRLREQQPPEPDEISVDPDTREGLNAYMVARLNGYEDGGDGD